MMQGRAGSGQKGLMYATAAQAKNPNPTVALGVTKRHKTRGAGCSSTPSTAFDGTFDKFVATWPAYGGTRIDDSLMMDTLARFCEKRNSRE